MAARIPLLRYFTLLAAGMLPSIVGAQTPAADIEFFEKKIRPVLVEHCYSCHSTAKKQKGALVLDSRAGLLRGGDSGPAVVVGKPGESLLIKAVRYTDPELQMPPKGKLPAAVIADLEKWVAIGLPDPRTPGPIARPVKDPTRREFWAFRPVRRPVFPKVKAEDWERGSIDRFILAGLEKNGLKPAGDADRATRLRRAYFALVGLPPTPEQVDAFVQDKSQDAFARVVDALLASPHFGERWGRHWLDVARFAESSGGGRSLLFKDAWRYRDYVIQSFNIDKPFNRFITEQIAGDLLPYKTPEERTDNLIATAYLLLGPINYEEQDKPVLDMDIVDEQLDTIGKGILGMTIGCARCHDHKFDPIPTRDYYALAGILRSTHVVNHANVSQWLERPLPMPAAQEQAIVQHQQAVQALKAKILAAKNIEKKAVQKEVKEVNGEPIAARDLPGIVIDDVDAKKIGTWKHSVYSGRFVGQGYLYDDRAKKEEKTLTFVPQFKEDGIYEVRFSYVPHTNRASKVPVRIFHADGEKTVYIDERQTPPIDGRFVSLGRFRFEKGDQWFVMVSTEGADGYVAADAVQFLPEKAPAVTQTKHDSPKQALSALSVLEAELKELEARGPKRATTMAVEDAARKEDCHICIRGNLRNRGPLAPRGFLQVITPADVAARLAIPANESGRLQLAAWLTDADNPLTARVMVNRIWYHLVGAGLVRTLDNFGHTGEFPSHPELLDYLALRFVEEGWSVKKLIREIMLSHTYQMRSEVDVQDKAAQAIDPENRLLWHMNRRRLDAEVIRDLMLAVGGNLDCTMGGPTMVKIVRERDFKFDDTRRSVYTPVLRNRLHELFEVFDMADPNVCQGKRNVSTVATQALYLMNSPFVLEQSRIAARKILKASVADEQARVNHVYRLILGRSPSGRERDLALAFLGVGGAETRVANWERFVQTLFACVDFRYVN